ncbi:MAG: hypothetical protein ACR2HS_02140 [Gammaproteobacteria bacterium]
MASNQLYRVVLIGDNGQNLMTLQETENNKDISKIETIFHEHVVSVAASLATSCMIEKIAENRKFSYYVCVDDAKNIVPAFNKYVRFTNNASEVNPEMKMLMESDMLKQMCQKMKLQVSKN